jgi:hypothetical protein
VKAGNRDGAFHTSLSEEEILAVRSALEPSNQENETAEAKVTSLQHQLEALPNNRKNTESLDDRIAFLSRR